MSEKRLTRRDFVKAVAGAVGAGLLASCAPATPQVVEQVVEVEKEVTKEVEKTVRETVVVEETVEVREVVELRPGEPNWSPPDLSGEAEITLWGLQYDPHIQLYNGVIDRFVEKTNGKVKLEPQEWPLETKVIAALAAGTGPDVTCIMGKQIPGLIDEGALLPVDDEVFAATGLDPDKWFNDAALGAYEHEGRHYGIPMEDNCESMAVGCRLDFLREAPADVQELWPPNQGEDRFHSYEDMWALAEGLHRVDDDGNVVVWGMNQNGWENRTVFSIMRDLGRMWWDKEKGQFYLDSPEAEEALRLFVGVPVFERGFETHLDVSHPFALMEGRAALGRGDQAMAYLANEAGIEVEMVLCPSPNPGRMPLFVGEAGWGFQGLTTSENKEVAVEFLKHVCTFDVQKWWATWGMPACAAVVEVAYQEDDIVSRSKRRILPAVLNGVYYGSGFGPPSQMEEITCTAIQEYRMGEISIKECMTNMQEGMEAMYEEYVGG